MQYCTSINKTPKVISISMYFCHVGLAIYYFIHSCRFKNYSYCISGLLPYFLRLKIILGLTENSFRWLQQIEKLIHDLKHIMVAFYLYLSDIAMDV